MVSTLGLIICRPAMLDCIAKDSDCLRHHYLLIDFLIKQHIIHLITFWKNPPFCSFTLFSIVLLTLFINRPDSQRDVAFISSFKIIYAIIPVPNLFLNGFVHLLLLLLLILMLSKFLQVMVWVHFLLMINQFLVTV